MVQYYTLEQAAQILRTTPDMLKEMAKKNEVRAFQDRGTLRFRAQEIDELARLRGLGSDPELPLSEPASPKPAPKSAPGKQTTHVPAGAGGFDFNLEVDDSDEVPLGKEPAPGPGKTPSGHKSPAPKSGGPKSPAPKSAGPKSPPPKAGSDSDVRLVMDGSDLDFQIDVDSPHGSKPPASKPPSSKTHGSKEAKPPSSKKSGVPPVSDAPDSGVRIVPLDQPSDSDVKIVPSPGAHDSDVPLGEAKPRTASDSDIRIEQLGQPPSATQSGARRRDQEGHITEEIDLDAEARKAEEAAKKTARPKGRSQAKPSGLPTSSPFELSDSGTSQSRAPAGKDPATTSEEDSSDFELKPLSTSELSPLEPDSDEVPKLAGDEEVELGTQKPAAHDSGINLQDPADSGISLEEGGSDEIEFELSLDSATTPKPTTPPPSQAEHDSSSEFELSLQDEDASPTVDSDSEFELSLDVEGSSELALEKVEADSDSEFELTLDESGTLAPAEESGEKDIFETDFEVPALEEESGSEAVALDEGDTDLESSDFDLALDEESAGESGSQVVALEGDEEADASAATVARPRKAAAVAEEGEEIPEEDFEGDLGEAAEEEEEEGAPARAAAAPAAPAEWPTWVPFPLLLCSIVMFLAMLMSFELVQGLWGYHHSGAVSNALINPIARMFGNEDLPKD